MSSSCHGKQVLTRPVPSRSDKCGRWRMDLPIAPAARPEAAELRGDAADGDLAAYQEALAALDKLTE